MLAAKQVPGLPRPSIASERCGQSPPPRRELAKEPREAAVLEDPALGLAGRAVVDRVLLEVHARDRGSAHVAGLGQLVVHAIRLLVVRSALSQLQAARELGV